MAESFTNQAREQAESKSSFFKREKILGEFRTMRSKPKINKTTFSFGGGSIENKVANNSRKITILKNIISTGKSDLGGKLASIDGRSSPESNLTEINDTLNDIGNALALDFANRIAIEKGENRRLKTDASKQKNERAEGRVEKSVKGGLSKVMSPIAKAGKKLADISKLLALSVIGNTLFDILETPKEESKENLTKILVGDETKPKPKGFMRGLAGTADFFTGDLFDFDNRGYFGGQTAVDVMNSDNPKKTFTDKFFGFFKGKNNQSGSTFRAPGADKAEKVRTGGNNVNIPNLNKVNKKGTVTEITAPTIKLDKQNDLQSVPSADDGTFVPPVSSVNTLNNNMFKTPKTHGIIVD